MANPSKAKGTKGETELVRLLGSYGLSFVRTPPGSPYDLTNADPGLMELDPLEVLATRPDRGEWLMSLRADAFAQLLAFTGAVPYTVGVWETHIEVKRYKKFALHTIYEGKFS